jgi:hypothetical protein
MPTSAHRLRLPNGVHGLVSHVLDGAHAGGLHNSTAALNGHALVHGTFDTGRHRSPADADLPASQISNCVAEATGEVGHF